MFKQISAVDGQDLWKMSDSGSRYPIQLLHLLGHMHIRYTQVGAPPEPCPRRDQVDQQGCLSSRHTTRLWGSPTCSLRPIRSLDERIVSRR